MFFVRVGRFQGSLPSAWSPLRVKYHYPARANKRTDANTHYERHVAHVYRIMDDCTLTCLRSSYCADLYTLMLFLAASVALNALLTFIFLNTAALWLFPSLVYVSVDHIHPTLLLLLLSLNTISLFSLSRGSFEIAHRLIISLQLTENNKLHWSCQQKL